MLKKRLTILLAVLMAFSMSVCLGCGDKENSGTEEVSTESVSIEESVIEETAEETTVEETEGTTAEVILTGWENLEFEFAGVAFAVPFEAGVLGTNGWTLSGLEDEYTADYVLEAGTKVSNFYAAANPVYNSDVRTLVGLVNNSDSAAKATECDVWSFVCNIYDETNGVLYENAPELKLANDITWGSTPDEIIAAYGEPMSTIEGETDDYTVHMYMYNGLNIMKLMTRDDLGLVEVVLLSYNE